MKQHWFSHILVAMVALAASSALAGTVPLPQAARGDGVTGAIGLDTSYLTGKAKEHVFAKGADYGPDLGLPSDSRRHQVSRLDWDMTDVFLLGVLGSVRSGPFSLNAGLWGGLGDDDAGHMKDYDWMAGDRPEAHGPLSEGASDYSRSDDTVTSAFIGDLNVSFDLLTSSDTYHLYPFVGMRYERYEWDANGAHVLYSDNNYVPEYIPGKGIEYRQEYFQPYLGLGGDCVLGALTLSGYGRFAPVYWCKGKDDHIVRGHFITEDESDWECFDDVAYGLGIRAEWAFTQAFALNAGIDWTRYALAETDTKVINPGDDDEEEEDEDEDIRAFGGIEMENLTVSVGVTFRF
ncbi:MAG: omptin family outer membrane protease [Kiritimatiellae bacterium]|nr:omptin family outer membrane protease [Kiritimatiellia bacterium]